MKIISLLISLCLLSAISPTGLCNKELMKKFFLTGQTYSTFSPMKTCAHIKDRCCTIIDEIQITKLWNQRTAPFLSSYYDQIIHQMANIMEIFKNVAKLDPRNMLLKYLRRRKVPYFYEFCNEQREPFTSEKVIAFQSHLEKLKFDSLKLSLKGEEGNLNLQNISFNDNQKNEDAKQLQKNSIIYKEQRYEGNRKNERNQERWKNKRRFQKEIQKKSRKQFEDELASEEEYQRQQREDEEQDRLEQAHQGGINPITHMINKFNPANWYNQQNQNNYRERYDQNDRNELSSYDNQNSSRSSDSWNRRGSRDSNRLSEDDDQSSRRSRKKGRNSSSRSSRNNDSNSSERGSKRKGRNSTSRSSRNNDSNSSESSRKKGRNASRRSKKSSRRSRNKSKSRKSKRRSQKRRRDDDNDRDRILESNIISKSNNDTKIDNQNSNQMIQQRILEERFLRRKGGKRGGRKSFFGGLFKKKKKPKKQVVRQRQPQQRRQPPPQPYQQPPPQPYQQPPPQPYQQPTPKAQPIPKIQKHTPIPQKVSPPVQPKVIRQPIVLKPVAPAKKKEPKVKREKQQIASSESSEELFFEKEHSLIDFAMDPQLIRNHKLQVCTSQRRVFEKDFVIINSLKTKFCYELYEKMINFDNDKFILYIPLVKQQLKIMEEYRSNFYCNLCDVHSQKFFDVTKKEVYLSEGFCKNLLIRHEPNIKFLNILFVEYVDFILRTQSCYDSSPQPAALVIQNFLNKYKRRIPLIQNCYQAAQSGVTGDEFMKQCWFLCKSFKWDRVSKIFEGDLELFKKIYLALFSFQRRMLQIEEPVRVRKDQFPKKRIPLNLDDINGLLLEPLNPSIAVTQNKFYLDNVSRKIILGKIKSFSYLTKVQIKMLEKYLRKHMVHENVQFIIRLIQSRQKIMRNYFQRKRFNKMITRLLKKSNSKQENLPSIKYMKFKRAELKDTPLNLMTESRKRTSRKRNSKKRTSKKKLRKSRKERRLEEQKSLKKIKDISLKIINLISKNDRVLKQQNKQDRNGFKQNIYPQYQQYERHLSAKNQKNKRKFQGRQNKARVENGVEVFEKQKNLIDIDAYAQEYQILGIDLMRNSYMVNFSINTEDLISQVFQKNDELKVSTIQEYLSITPKFINTFNNKIDDLIQVQMEIEKDTHKYMLKKKELLETEDTKKTIAIKEDIKKIESDLSKVIESKENRIFIQKQKQKLKDMKIHQMNQSTTVVENHVDKKHFDQHFNGLQNLFVSIFGSR